VSESLFTTQTPTLTDVDDGGVNITLGTLMTFAVAGNVAGVRWYAPTTQPSITPKASLYRYTSESSGVLLAGPKDIAAPIGGGWTQVLFDAPVAVQAAPTKYVVAVWTNRYTATPFLLQTPIVNGNITAPADVGGQGNGRFIEPSVAPAYPDSTFHSTSYFVDVLFDAGGAGQTIDIAATLAATSGGTAALDRIGELAATLNARAFLIAALSGTRINATSTPAVAARRTSTPGVTSRRTSMPAVSDGG
jgi:hypothetical protein